MNHSVSPIVSWFAMSCALAAPLTMTNRATANSEDAMPHSLVERFDNPPAEARPHTWWHWMNGNVSKEGITADLEWMKRVGIGGASVFHVGIIPVAGPLVQDTDPWYDHIRFAIEECARLGLEFGWHNCSGWSQMAGPWVDPDESMKVLTFSQAFVDSATATPIKLPQPYVQQVTPFSDINTMNAKVERYGKDRTDYPPYYRDIGVYAYRMPEGIEPSASADNFTVESSLGTIEPADLVDGDPFTKLSIDPRIVSQQKTATITLNFKRPFTARSAFLQSGSSSNYLVSCDLILEASDDGKTFRKVCDMNIEGIIGPLYLRDGSSFEAVTAKIFRLTITPDAKRQGRPGGQELPSIAELQLSSEPRVNDWTLKAGFSRGQGGTSNPTAAQFANELLIPRDGLLNLTEKLQEDGTLNWQPPQGRWAILRVGMTTTGKASHPAAVGGVGLEVDKLAPGAFEKYAQDGILQKIVDLAGGHAGTTLKEFATDSWEVGAQNWTEGFDKEFQKRRGYDPLPWLPCTNGLIIGSVDESERFLWDLRRTISELIAENNYGALQAFCHRNGMVAAGEPYGTGCFDNHETGRHVDIPATVFWVGRPFVENNIRDMASIINTSGASRIVAAEAYTASGEDAMWREHPGSMKAMGDAALATGVNRFVFHRSAHQPWMNVEPGMTMGPFGINLERTTTWAEQSKAWMTYITRCQALLQEGQTVSDVLIYNGEDAPNGTNVFTKTNVPRGYGYDTCWIGVIHSAKVEDGQIVLPTGMRYRLLMLPQMYDRVTPGTIAKLQKLVEAGAHVLLGVKPVGSPSLTGYPECDEQVRSIADALWPEDANAKNWSKQVGKGRVYFGITPTQALQRLKLEPNWIVTQAPSQGTVRAIQRTTEDGEFYFVACDNAEPQRIELSLRTTGDIVELWDPYLGTRLPARRARSQDGRTIVPLDLPPNGSVFIVFPKQPTVDPNTPEVVLNDAGSTLIQDTWTLSFPAGKGAPAEPITLETLNDWAKHELAGVKYFSGTATYSTRFHVSSDRLSEGRRLFLDLGQVHELAEVSVNGKDLGVLWSRPFRVDITQATQPGDNTLVVKVTNLWPNRLIGDAREQPGASLANPLAMTDWPQWIGQATRDAQGRLPDGQFTFTAWPYWKAEDELLPSGLLGPVTLIPASIDMGSD